MDHEHYRWSPLVRRKPLRWPGNARIALSVIVNLEHMEWQTPAGAYQSPTLSGGLVPRPFPDYMRFSHREYGHRVGIFRLLDVLERHGIRPTVAMDAVTAEHYPYLVQHCLARGCEIIGHGVSVSRMITSHMSEDEESEYIRTSIEILQRTTGARPAGWFGPEYGESVRTPALLTQAGIRYVCDWPNDEQPYELTTPHGSLVALPILLGLDDVNALWERRVPVDRYARMLMEGFDAMYEDGQETGRILVLNLHPWLIGQAFRIGYLDQALGHMARYESVWAATGSEVVDWYRATVDDTRPRD
jgi:peptidoglycan/xylan/chitin deacetylase (PgdA/CDA1 family)